MQLKSRTYSPAGNGTIVLRTAVQASMEEIYPRITEDDESSLRWLIKQFQPGQWQQMAKALQLIRENSGYGRFSFVVRDGAIQDHPKVEISF